MRIDRAGSVEQFQDTLRALRLEYGRSVLSEESDAIVQARRLGAKVQERRGRAASLRKRIIELQQELAVFEQEATGYERGVEALLGAVVERIETRHAPAWSPWPVFGYRIWSLRSDGLHGARVHWRKPELTARCGNGRFDEGVPHSNEMCGPPSCGIYAVKDVNVLLGSYPIEDPGHFAIGLVSLTGRVVEHTRAYRAQHARVVAISAVVGRRMLLTSDRQRIHELFADAGTAALTFPEVTENAGEVDRRAIDFLIDQERNHTEWTSENNNESSP